jgi:hypothetical protein
VDLALTGHSPILSVAATHVDEAGVLPSGRVVLSRTIQRYHGNSARKFAHIDAYVHERLAIFASIKHGLHGRNQHRFNWVWFTSLGVYLLSGRVRSGAAHALR